MNIHKAFKSEDYFTHADIDGDELKVVIAKVTMEETKFPPKEPAPHVYFDGVDKPLVLNKTNANKLALRFGEETDEWAGKSVTLRVGEVTYEGVERPCVRVK